MQLIKKLCIFWKRKKIKRTKKDTDSTLKNKNGTSKKGWRLKGKKGSKLFTLLDRRLKRLRDWVIRPTLNTRKRLSNFKLWRKRKSRMKLYYPSNEVKEIWHKKCNAMRTYCFNLTRKLCKASYNCSKYNWILKKRMMLIRLRLSAYERELWSRLSTRIKLLTTTWLCKKRCKFQGALK